MSTNELMEILSPGITTSKDKFDTLQDELKRNGVINLTLNDGTVIKDIKAIAKWGVGLYYGHITGQKNFNKSISINDIQL